MPGLSTLHLRKKFNFQWSIDVAQQISISAHMPLFALYLTSKDRCLILGEVFDTIWLSYILPLVVARVKERIKEKEQDCFHRPYFPPKQVKNSRDSSSIRHSGSKGVTLTGVMAWAPYPIPCQSPRMVHNPSPVQNSSHQSTQAIATHWSELEIGPPCQFLFQQRHPLTLNLYTGHWCPRFSKEVGGNLNERAEDECIWSSL